MNIYAKILFFVFLGIFCLTALVTILALIHVLTIDDKYLSKLFPSLILGVVGWVITLSKSLWMKQGKVKLRFDVPGPFDLKAAQTFGYTAKLINQDENNKATDLKEKLYSDEYGLCSDVEITNYKQTLYVTIDIAGKKYEGSEWLETRRIKLSPKN